MSEKDESKYSKKSKFSQWMQKYKEVAFFSVLAGMSVVSGFAMTLTLAKRRDPSMFGKGLVAGREVPESGGALAMRALGRGSLYAVGGFTVFCLTIWKLTGVHSMDELRSKIQKVVPAAPRQEPAGRNEFGSVRELVNYLIDEDQRTKLQRKNK